MSVTKSPWPSLDLILFGSAIAIGIFGAWIGLGTSSFWIDELTTRWIVFGDGAGDGMTGRLVTDVHPPLYYALLYAYAHLVGASDAALRSFSALTACGAVVAFILGAQGAFSLRARLFAAGVATGSAFWFYQSQNARDYGLSTLLAALILSLALALLRNDRRCGSSALWGGLAVVMLLGSLNHFYMTFLAVAVLGVLFLYLPRYRLATTVGAGLLLGFSVAYTRLIIEPYTQYSLTENWIRGDLAWNKTIVVSAVMMSVNKLAALAVALCGAVLIARLAPTVRASKPSLGGAIGWLKANPAAVLCSLVPVVVIGEGMASALVTSANLTDRNILVCSPFVWGLAALIFDAAFDGVASGVRRAVRIATAVLILVSASVVAGRALPRNEPFKESAAWIKSLPACRGAEIPVLQTDRKAWAKPAFAARTTRYAYGRYLAGYAHPRMLYLEDVLSGQIPADLTSELRPRLSGAECPVVAWSEHAISEQQASAAGQALTTAAGFNGPRAPKLGLKTFPIYGFSIIWKQKNPAGYVIYVEHPGDSALAH